MLLSPSGRNLRCEGSIQPGPEDGVGWAVRDVRLSVVCDPTLRGRGCWAPLRNTALGIWHVGMLKPFPGLCRLLGGVTSEPRLRRVAHALCTHRTLQKRQVSPPEDRAWERSPGCAPEPGLCTGLLPPRLSVQEALLLASPTHCCFSSVPGHHVYALWGWCLAPMPPSPRRACPPCRPLDPTLQSPLCWVRRGCGGTCRLRPCRKERGTLLHRLMPTSSQDGGEVTPGRHLEILSRRRTLDYLSPLFTFTSDVL